MLKLGDSLNQVFVRNGLAQAIGSYEPLMVPQSPGGGGGLDPGSTSSWPSSSTSSGGGGRDDDLDDGEVTPWLPGPLRQDQFIPLPPLPAVTPEELAAASSREAARLIARLEAEVTCIHVLRMVALALNAPFLDAVNRAGASFLAEPVSGGGIKEGYPRMPAKMFSRADHLREAYPRPAMNVDIVRCLTVFDTAAQMRRGFDSFAGSFRGGCFRPEIQERHALGRRRGRPRASSTCAWCWPRSSCATRRHRAPRAPCARTRRCGASLWDRYEDVVELSEEEEEEEEEAHARKSVADGLNSVQWQRLARAARAWLEQLPAAAPVRMACEIQCLLRRYRDVRLAMHEPYRLVRADSDKALYRDFVKYASEATARRTFVADGGSRYLRACRDGHAA